MMKNARDYTELLRHGVWFSALPGALADQLVGAAAVLDLKPDQVLFSRGDAPSGLYAVIDGGIRVSGVSEAGKEALLTLLEPPQWFGEVSLFDGQPRTHDAIADGETRVLHVPQAALDRLLAAEPRWWRDFGLLLSGKLRLAFI